MGERRASIADFTVIFTEITFMACLYYLFSFLQTDVIMEIGLLPWLGMALAGYLLLYWFTPGRTVGQAAALGAVLFAVQAAILAIFFCTAQGFSAWAFALLFVGIGAIRSVYLCVVPIPRERYLSYTECSILGAALILLAQASGMIYPTHYLLCLFAAVAGCFFSTVRARVTSDGGETLSLSKGQGIVALCAVGTVAGAMLAAAVALFALPVQQGLHTAVDTGKTVLGALLSGISRFMLWLISLLPAPKQGTYDLGAPVQTPELTGQAEAEIQMLPAWVLTLALVVLVAAVTLVAVLVLRRAKLGGVRIAKRKKSAVRAKKASLLDAWRRWLAAKCFAVQFAWHAFRWRNTPQGLFVWLEGWGRVHKLPRGTGETCRRYLKRLAQTAALSDTVLAQRLTQLSDELDAVYFSPAKKSAKKTAHTGIAGLRRELRGQVLGKIKAELSREQKRAKAKT